MLILNRTVAFFGKIAGWLTTALVMIIFIDVVLRYAFNFSKTWIIDLEWHLFAAIFLLGSAYAWQKNKHVRVDVFYDHFSTKKKLMINALGTALLALPWIVLLISKSYNYAINSWSIKEGSSNPGGLEYRYIIKFVMVLGFVLLLMEAIRQLINAGKKLKS